MRIWRSKRPNQNDANKNPKKSKEPVMTIQRMREGFHFKLNNGARVSHNEILMIVPPESKEDDFIYLQRQDMYDIVESEQGDVIEATNEGLDGLYRTRFSLLKDVFYDSHYNSHFVIHVKFDETGDRFLPVLPLERPSLVDESDALNLETAIESASKYVPEDKKDSDQAPAHSRKRYNSNLDLVVRFDEREGKAVRKLNIRNDEELDFMTEEEARRILDEGLKGAAQIERDEAQITKEYELKRLKIFSWGGEHWRRKQLSFKPSSDFERFEPWWSTHFIWTVGHILPTLTARMNVECASYELFSEGKISGGSEADKVLRMIKPSLPAGPVLFEHQQAALAWLAWKTRPSSFCRGGMICDESGLGKTNICLAFLMMRLNKLAGETPKGADPFAGDENQRVIRSTEDTAAARDDRKPKRFLIAVPAQLLPEWRRQVQEQLEATGYRPDQYRVIEIVDHTFALPLDDAGLEVDVHLVSYSRLSVMQGELFEILYGTLYYNTVMGRDEVPYSVRRIQDEEELEANVHILVEIARRIKSRSNPSTSRFEEATRSQNAGRKGPGKSKGPPAKKAKVRVSERSAELYEKYPELDDAGMESYRRWLRLLFHTRSNNAKYRLEERTNEWYDTNDFMHLDDHHLSLYVSSMRFFAGTYDTMICDETSKLTRIEAKCTNAAIRVNATRKILVSASPIVRDRGEKGAFDMYAPLCILGSPDVWNISMPQRMYTQKEYEAECGTPLGKIRRTPNATNFELRLSRNKFMDRVRMYGFGTYDGANFKSLTSTYVWRNRKCDIDFADPVNESSSEASSRHLPSPMPEDIIYRDLIPFKKPEEKELYDYMMKMYSLEGNRRAETASNMGTRMASNVSSYLMSVCNDFYLLDQIEKRRLFLYVRMCLEQEYGIDTKAKGADSSPTSLSDMGLRTVDYLVGCYEILRDDRSVECCVCYEHMTLIENAKGGEFADNAAVVFECAHATCCGCLIKMFATGRSEVTCPLCRKAIKSLEGALAFTRSVSQEAQARRNPGWLPPEPEPDEGEREAKSLIEAKMKIYKGILYDEKRESTKTLFLRDSLYDIGVGHPGDKVILICQMESYCKRIKENLTKVPLTKGGSDVSICVRAFRATSKGRKMVECIEKFRSAPEEKGVVDVLIMTYLSGSLGHNLQFANHLFLVHPFENNALEFQARHRIVRIGQTKIAHTHRIAIANSIEEDLIELNETYDRDEAIKDGSRKEKQSLAYKLLAK